jgi:hypothetical protein
MLNFCAVPRLAELPVEVSRAFDILRVFEPWLRVAAG